MSLPSTESPATRTPDRTPDRMPDTAGAAASGHAGSTHPPAEAESGSGEGRAPLPQPGGWWHGRFLRAIVGAEHMTLEIRSNGRSQQLLKQVVLDYLELEPAPDPPHPADLAAALCALPPAIARLQEEMAGTGIGLRGLACDVIIDDSWMLYDVVRADLRSLAPRAADALIGASLADIAGVPPAALASRWHSQGDHERTLACALPVGTLLQLQQALQPHRIAIGVLEGEFVHEFNRARDRIDPRCSVIAVVRSAGAQLGVLIDGAIASMSFEFGVGTHKELELRGRGLLRAAGGSEACVRFYAASLPSRRAPEPWIPLAAVA